jgi:hypothetical protein
MPTIKRNAKSRWRNQFKIKFTDEEFEYLWGVYTTLDTCLKCGIEFKNSRDKCLDHNHDTGEIRNILCQLCNKNTDRRLKPNFLGVPNLCIHVNKGNEYYLYEKQYNNKKIAKTWSCKNYSIEQVKSFIKELNK